MKVLDTPLRNVAVKLLDLLAKDATLRLKGRWGFDSDTLEAKPNDTDVAVSIAIDETVLRSFGQTTAPGESDRARSFDGTLAARDLPRAPAPADELVVDGVIYRIAQVSAVYSGDLTAIYQLRMAR